ncbi:molybdate ABC transporter substrate-binding protein [Robertmurraya sp. DFI.2.37]|uniref:molybdate ABC transporter substrate-binding protein n=1 Tax=Robertmurraya sp. DFI.2.37 TaxID=3031819 RepID=UPI00124830B7|nr:molybdate ABC transporter substrate-binding protein [Robertmurraya sp. DFI.2.37]MDF1508737.1 molybdate ABC transporter substrate-binding protein [Robertmurraya sp. DFI.2.37]
MKNKWKIGMIFILILIVGVGCNNQEASDDTPTENTNQQDNTELLISTAASLTDAMTEIEKAFEDEYSNIDVSFNYGSSGTLAQQIQQGAPADAFLSADQKWMDTLEKESLILPETRVDFTGNKLVLISQKDHNLTISSFEDLIPAEIGDLAIGNPESVPAGTYAKEVLTKLNKWEDLEKHLILAKDVRQVLTYVESGNTELGIVYSSDASISDQVKIIAEASSDWHTPVIYPAAVTADSKNADSAKLFIEFLQTEEAQNILNQFGFIK